MLLLITVMCVIAEKKLQLNSASLYVVVIFIIGGILIGGARAPSLATPMLLIPAAGTVIHLRDPIFIYYYDSMLKPIQFIICRQRWAPILQT